MLNVTQNTYSISNQEKCSFHFHFYFNIPLSLEQRPLTCQQISLFLHYIKHQCNLILILQEVILGFLELWGCEGKGV